MFFFFCKLKYYIKQRDLTDFIFIPVTKIPAVVCLRGATAPGSNYFGVSGQQIVVRAFILYFFFFLEKFINYNNLSSQANIRQQISLLIININTAILCNKFPHR